MAVGHLSAALLFGALLSISYTSVAARSSCEQDDGKVDEKVTTCPTSSPGWTSTAGVSGAILTKKGDDKRIKDTKKGKKGDPWSNDTISHMFWYSKSDTKDTYSCYAKCQGFAQTADRDNTYNEQTSSCSYWSYNTKEGDCFLFDCSACSGPSSFTTVKSDKGTYYVSGGGPQSCGGGGGVTGDPHFTGGDSSHFDFSGAPNNNYCLVTDSHLHINGYFGGRLETSGRHTKVLNWIRQVGILWGHHTIRFEAREGARWQYDNGYLKSIQFDGEEVILSQPDDIARFADGKVEIEWIAAQELSGDDETDLYAIRINGALNMQLRLRPEVATLRTPEDGTVHFDLSFPSLLVSNEAHGVLGQTYRQDHASRLAKVNLEHSELLGVDVVPGDNGRSFLDGSHETYLASNLLLADCGVSRFARFEKFDVETAQAISASLGGVVSTVGRPRKVLRMVTA